MIRPFIKKTLNCGSLLLPLLMLPPVLLAQTDAATIAELRTQIEALSARLEQLEENQTDNPVADAPSQTSQSWVNNIRISGDLRTRYEHIDDATQAKDRNRNRLRARLDLSATVNQDWAMSLGLASGNADPISTNQTLGSGSSSKSLVLDYAYFEYTGLDNFTLSGGKYKNVFYRAGGNAMLWDGDYRPEGLALEYSANGLFFNAATMILESDDKAGAQDKATMWGGQAGYRNGGLTVGAGYFDASVQGSMGFYDNDLFGNSADGTGAFLYDFEEVELFAVYDFTLADFELSLFADLVRNQAADADDTGWVAGTSVARDTWELSYSYQELEANAVFATFTDSDFGGGGTGASGHIISGGLDLARRTSIGFTYFINELGAAETDYNRLQLDLSVAF